MDLTMARITTLNSLSMGATNQFLGSSTPRFPLLFAHFVRHQRLLVVSNLVKSTIVQRRLHYDLWSTSITSDCGITTFIMSCSPMPDGRLFLPL